MPIISINVLAKRSQSSNLHKLLGRTHEYGWKVEAKNWLWTSCCCFRVSINLMIKWNNLKVSQMLCMVYIKRFPKDYKFKTFIREREVKESLFFGAKTLYLGPEQFCISTLPSPQTPTCNIAETRSIKDGAQAVFEISFVIRLSCPPNKDTNAPWTTTIDLDSSILSGNTVNVANKITLIVGLTALLT